MSALWWGGVGVAIRDTHRRFGAFTLLLAAFAMWDAVLTAFEPVPFTLYLTAAPKLPLAIVWDFWLGAVLLELAQVDSTRRANSLSDSSYHVSG